MMSKQPAESVYLGDGVYLNSNSLGLNIAVGDHRDVKVYLDSNVFLRLVEHGTRILQAKADEVGVDFVNEVHSVLRKIPT